jgi:hypothetical protein
MKDSIKNICVKYLMHEANLEELETLDNWLQKPKNKQLFANYIKVNYAMDMYMNPFDTETAKKEYLERIRKDKRIQKKRKLLKTVRYAAAAILIIALASTYFLNDTIFNNKIENTPPTIVNNQIEPGIDKATLTLENGEQVTLEKGTQFQTQNATSNGEEITYLPAGRQGIKSTSRELVNNYLTIPRGGQFQMTLSDGTRVWLNSETQLKYPVSFTDGESRQVELVYGEAYFDVSPSTEHSGANFKVFNNNQEVEVLGTEFNIKAYKDETNIYTTLVEGKVAISTADTNQILAPNQQSSLDLKNNKISIATVDVHNETSWKEGVFDFTKMPLKDIMKVLSRWYDMDVIFVNKNLEDIIFTGRFNKNRSIEDILLTIKNINFINNYKIINKRLVIK